jgi:hypothetical protein
MEGGMNRAIVTYAAGGHEELLEVALPAYRAFAERHGYDVIIGSKVFDLPPAWNKIPLMLQLLQCCDEVVWLDCDLVIVNPADDFPSLEPIYSHSLVRHFENHSEIPNSGVWRVNQRAIPLLEGILNLKVFTDHGWWEQAALMTLMGYTVPPEGSKFPETKCRNVVRTRWYEECQFMRLSWNSHPMYRSESPRIVHCSYPNMTQRIEVMRELVRNPSFDYPRYDEVCPHCKKSTAEVEDESED